MITRRLLCTGFAALSVSGARAHAQTRTYEELSELPPLPPRYQLLADEPPMNEEFTDVVSVQGTLQPSDEETEVANEIIEAVNALGSVRPVEIAGYLLDVARGKYGETWRPYTRAWPVDAHANPLILNFFRATKSSPRGDMTAWCAAFVNWCISKSHNGNTPTGGHPRTESAASSSFRNWGTPSLSRDASFHIVKATEPAVGDVVVFQEMRSNGTPDPFHGHVAFFLDMDNRRVKVLGGNQFQGKPVVHAINVMWIPIDGRLSLHSIRTDPTLGSP